MRGLMKEILIESTNRIAGLIESDSFLIQSDSFLILADFTLFFDEIILIHKSICGIAEMIWAAHGLFSRM